MALGSLPESLKLRAGKRSHCADQRHIRRGSTTRPDSGRAGLLSLPTSIRRWEDTIGRCGVLGTLTGEDEAVVFVNSFLKLAEKPLGVSRVGDRPQTVDV